MVIKSKHLHPDTLVFDLEDSVAGHRKSAARRIVFQALQDAPERSPELCVRINPPSEDQSLAASDLDVIMQSGRLQAILIPKVESAEDVVFVVNKISESKPAYVPPLAVIVSVESAHSLCNLPEIIAASQKHIETHLSDGIVKIAAVLFASEDYCATTGVKRTLSRKGLWYPRAAMVTTAKGMGLEAIDMVCIDYKKQEYLLEECEEGAEFGFDGKQAIHPAQIATINAVFSPTKQGQGNPFGIHRGCGTPKQGRYNSHA
ncbi:hypothetical protein MVES_000397 [Malassezia vespertilionis]|uniref:HpcH/HpaI aldolase/citrate lyase domain-containing protein n=1 Tax=Malassezia vespertilionis TaxID=2020962 RepID=A0A2N1JGZ9_9BASI|nr:hypothetical protein MVES_000397 [Malassezia vespertilionis]